MRVYVEYEIEVPGVDASDEEIEEWLRYETNDNGCMSTKNPLYHTPIEPVFGTLWWERK